MPRIQNIRARRGLAADWTTPNPVLDPGELGIETDTRAVKFGDGVTAWAALPYTSRPAVPYPFSPPSGNWQHPDHFSSSLNNSPGPTGTVLFTPLSIGPLAKTYDRLAVSVVTAQAGGATTFTLGLYPDDGTGGAPNTAAGPLTSGSVPLTAIGYAMLTIAGLRQPGRYWLASLYVVTTAPTTTASVVCVSNVAPTLWFPSTAVIGGIVRGLGLTSQVLPTTASSPVGTGSGNIPVIAARAA